MIFPAEFGQSLGSHSKFSWEILSKGESTKWIANHVNHQPLGQDQTATLGTQYPYFCCKCVDSLTSPANQVTRN